MRLLLAFCLLLPALAIAQQQTVRGCPDESAIGKSSSNWANCEGETWEFPDPQLIVSVRKDAVTNPTWMRASDAIANLPDGLIVVCTKLAVGSTADCGNTRARIDALNWGGQPEPPEPPTVPPTSGSLVVSWKPVTTFTDDSPITDPAAVVYRVENSAHEAGPWSSVWSGSALIATVPRPNEGVYTRVLATYDGIDSFPSESVFTPAPSPSPPGSPPSAPIIVGDAPKALSLVAGTAGGARAAYSRSSTGSRGPKLGDLNVGPSTITDYARIRCDVGDVFTYGSVRYARITDERAGSLNGAFVSGCQYVGLH